MSVPLAGYDTRRLLRASRRAHVYEALRKHDRRRVLAKVFELDDEGVEARVEHEFRLLEQLEIEGVVRALGIERVGEQLVLLLDYVDGSNLEQHARGEPMSVDAFLPTAVSLAATLSRIHDRRMVHRDIKPSNILIESGTGKVYLADFGISVLLESERRHLYDPEVLTKTLPYLSPEQTGRTTREVDFRSDLYSLGATFYELLTGRRPFEASAPLELIHAHLARRPTPPHELVPGLPRLLSAMIMKLLEKAPEHRYQSARGLGADLERFAEAWTAGERDPSFALCRHDHPTTLQLPHQLYGRGAELAALERELEAVVQHERRRLVLIRGEAGLGKSALIRGFEGPLSASKGYMAVGRFDLHARERPYSAFVEAFTSLIEQILTESDARLKRWRVDLREALGPIAGVIAELVPELALVLGDLAPVPPLELDESRNRLHLALLRFVAVFARRGPLVLAIDDLHAADVASLELLRALLLDGAEVPVLFVLTTRGGELGEDPASHPIAALRDEFDGADRKATQLELAPLVPAALESMLAEMLGRQRSEVAELAELVSRKTENNPLFVRQFLVRIAELGLLRATSEGWRWDTEEIALAQIPEDVLGIMCAKLEALEPQMLELVCAAACIGLRFDATLLEAATSFDSEALAAALYQLELEGLISTAGSGYVFGHDQLREAARGQLDEGRRAELHRAIGQHLLAGVEDDELTMGISEGLFAAVDHLDEALAVGMDDLAEGDRMELAKLNIRAGEQALQSAAWNIARRYFGVAVELLGPHIETARAGEVTSDLAFSAAFGHAQALALGGRGEAADEAFEILLDWQLSLSQLGQVIGRHVRILYMQERIGEALERGLAGLARCGFQLPRRATTAQMWWGLLGAWWEIRGVSVDAMLAMPEASDERYVAAMHIASALKSPAFVVQQELFVLISALHVRLVMGEGYHPTASEAFAAMAFALAGSGKVREARELSDVARELAEQRECTVSARINARASSELLVDPMIRPFRVCAASIEEGHRAASEAGERLAASYFAALGLVSHVEAGTHLGEIIELHDRMRAVGDGFGDRDTAVIAEAYLRLARHLSTPGDERPGLLTQDEIADYEFTAVSRAAVSVVELWGKTLLRDYEGAWELAKPLLGDFQRVLFGTVVIPRFALLASVLAAELGHCSEGAERRRLIGGLRSRLAVARKWARWCPENFQPMAELIEGELAALRGHSELALHKFEAVIRATLDSGAHWVTGLASVRLAAWAERWDLASTQQGALLRARVAFERWGARAMVDQLDQLDLEQGQPRPAYSGAPMKGSVHGASTLSSVSLGGGTSSISLDLATVVGTIRAISEDLHLEEVITRVLAGAIENAGADRGVLLLEHDGSFALVAEGRSDGQVFEFMAEPVMLADAGERLVSSALHFVLRTGEALVVDELGADPRFASDPYVESSGVRALLCMPIVKQSEQIGALVLENHLAAGAFTNERLEVLRILLAQAASALDNARLYAALARSEAQWRSLVDGAPDIIALMDERGQLEFINHLAPYDKKAEVLIGTNARETMDPRSRAAWDRALAEVVATGERRELEVCVAPEHRPRRYYMTRIAPVCVAGRAAGRVGKILSISTDITERRGLEAQVRQQQRLESIGTLASGVAHEINNPVQGILNYAELITTQVHEPDLVVEFATEITNESQRVAAIVRNLLAFSRREREQRQEEIQLGSLVRGTLALVRAVLRKDNVGLHVELPPDLPPLRCCPQQIQQVIMNLVTNARDALNERYAGFDERKRVEIRASSFGREGALWLRLTVEDAGGGMPEEVRARIFDPFFTTKGRDQGTGLGLAVSHGIAAEHGGELWVETEVGVGSCFHLDLPVGQG